MEATLTLEFKRKNLMANDYDWQKTRDKKMRWPYTGDVENKKYLKDRSKLFAEGGNGWWRFVGYQIRKKEQ